MTLSTLNTLMRLTVALLVTCMVVFGFVLMAGAQESGFVVKKGSAQMELGGEITVQVVMPVPADQRAQAASVLLSWPRDSMSIVDFSDRSSDIQAWVQDHTQATNHTLTMEGLVNTLFRGEELVMSDVTFRVERPGQHTITLSGGVFTVKESGKRMVYEHQAKLDLSVAEGVLVNFPEPPELEASRPAYGLENSLGETVREATVNSLSRSAKQERVLRILTTVLGAFVALLFVIFLILIRMMRRVIRDQRRGRVFLHTPTSV